MTIDLHSQLKLDGDEVELGDSFPVARRDAALSPSQREILRRAGEGPIRSVEAGVIVHGHRGAFGCPLARHVSHSGVGCCKYASADGLEACKRLAKRGLLLRTGHGIWETT